MPRIEDQINALAKTKVISTYELNAAYYQAPLSPEGKILYCFLSGWKALPVLSVLMELPMVSPPSE